MPADAALSVAISKSVFSFALMAAIAMACAVFIKALVAVLGVAGRRVAVAAPAPAPPPPAAPGIEPEVVAAISAAVAASVGAHRVIYIGEDHAAGWAADARHRHHASHDPHRAR